MYRRVLSATRQSAPARYSDEPLEANSRCISAEILSLSVAAQRAQFVESAGSVPVTSLWLAVSVTLSVTRQPAARTRRCAQPTGTAGSALIAVLHTTGRPVAGSMLWCPVG